MLNDILRLVRGEGDVKIKTSGGGCGDRSVQDKDIQRWMEMKMEGEDGAVRQPRK